MNKLVFFACLALFVAVAHAQYGYYGEAEAENSDDLKKREDDADVEKRQYGYYGDIKKREDDEGDVEKRAYYRRPVPRPRPKYRPRYGDLKKREADDDEGIEKRGYYRRPVYRPPRRRYYG